MQDIGVAVVGAGFIGPVHVEALRRLGVRVTGICYEIARAQGSGAVRGHSQEPPRRAVGERVKKKWEVGRSKVKGAERRTRVESHKSRPQSLSEQCVSPAFRHAASGTFVVRLVDFRLSDRSAAEEVIG